MKLTEIYPHILDAANALVPYYDPALIKAGGDLNLDGPETYLLLSLPSFEPGSISAEVLNIRSPYTSEEVYRRRLASLMRMGMLDNVDEDHFQLTSRALDAVKRLNDTAYAAMASLAPLPTQDLIHLEAFLQVRVQASLLAAEPPGKWCIQHSHASTPAMEAPIMARIDQYFSDLLAYRDDAHLASWKPYEINGHTWDVLTLLWLNESESIDSVMQKLVRRGNSFEQTEEAFRALVRMHWANYSLDFYTITREGREERQKAEELTDTYFYAPWKDISEKDLEDFVDLLLKYKQGLNA
jgi:hypothetical protein